jgi:pyruvate dehydrogenase E2 component (dihydrolipoamide acetyltransferase)
MASRDFLLPDLGEGLEDAEIVRWLVAEGDTVTLNQPLVEVETAKAMVEIPSPFAGTVSKLHGADGEVVKVGAPLVTFEVETGGNGDAAPKRQAVLVGYGPPPDEEPSGTAPMPSRGSAAGTAVRATPPVRKMAKDLGVDLAAVTGTGPNGRITRDDVETAAAAPPVRNMFAASVAPAAAPEDERVPVRGVRRRAAEHLAAAWRDIPHVTTFLTVDFTQVLAYRDEIQSETRDVKVSPLAIVGRALAEVAAEHRRINASWAGEEVVLHGRVHLGIATETEAGLLVPVVQDAGLKTISQLSGAIAEAAEAARSRKATPEQLTGSTITITNVGSFGAEYGTPIINAPEAAILSLGVIEPKALVVEGQVVPRPAAVLGLTFDHRVLDGAEAGRALKALGQVLESPFRLGALPR